MWICASETLGSRFPYKEMLDRDAVHVVMADLCWTGGLTEGRKIAAMADTYHRPFAPHDCIGPVGFIAGIHASFSQPNTLIQESVRAFYTGWYRELVTVMPVIENGYVLPMEGRGSARNCCPPSSSGPTSRCAARSCDGGRALCDWRSPARAGLRRVQRSLVAGRDRKRSVLVGIVRLRGHKTNEKCSFKEQLEL